jgi:hypothetical protein
VPTWRPCPARWPPQRGDRIGTQLLLHSQPLAHQPAELRNALSPIGLWPRSDADGRLELPLPPATRWLLRSNVLQPGAADDWDSHFLSAVFEVGAGQPGR